MPEGQKIIEDRYLADGVYASYDGYHVWLDLRGQQAPGKEVVRIAMDDTALDALLKYVEDLANALADAAARRVEQAKRAEETRVSKPKEPSRDTPNDQGS